MENQKLNIQTVVAVVFIFLLVAAAVTTVFAQEQTTEKKERTKIIQLKIVEDENGNVKSIDTTFVIDEDHDFDFYSFYNMNMNHFGDSMNIVLDIDTENFNILDVDPLLKEITVNIEDLGNGKIMMFMDDEMNEAMEDAGQTIQAYSFSFENEFSNADSLMEVIVKQYGKNGDSLMKTRFQHHINVDSDDDKVFIFSNGKKVNNDTDLKVIKVKGDKTIWVDDEGNVLNVDGAKYEFQSASEKDLEGLRDAGVKTKKKELQLKNLEFLPNPSNGKFNLSFTLTEKKKVTINVYDINGKVVYSETLKDFQGEYNKEIDISQQESGPFFLQIAQGLYDIIKKIIIQ